MKCNRYCDDGVGEVPCTVHSGCGRDECPSEKDRIARAAIDDLLQPVRVPAFEEWPEMSRYRTIKCMVTEKIDGTNAQIYVPADPEHPVLAGSRTRWLIDGATNFAFERWVAEHQTALRRLGPGRHYGEWYGAGVQRRYGLDHKRFALFNAGRWALNPETGKGGLPEGLPVELGVVPILYRGVFSSRKVDETIAKLYREGSIAVPGWRGPGKEGPEGVVVQVDGCRPWKLTDNGDAKKGRAHHVDAAAGAVSVDREWCDGGGAWTRVIGSNILGQDVVELLDEEATDEAIRAAIMTVANKIVTADAAILDARKAVQS